MCDRLHRLRGFTMTELLVVLVIVGVLSMGAVSIIRPRTSDSVRSLMSDLEGMLLNAENEARLTTGDIYITASGDWKPGGGNGNLAIDARPLAPGVSAATPANLAVLSPTLRVGPLSECFQSLYSQGRWDHMAAGVDSTGAWYAQACPGLRLEQTALFTDNASFTAAMANPLCVSSQNSVVLSNLNQYFVTGFCIVVVGLRGGYPVSNGPIGVLVVPAGGANIFKFYKPDSSSTWGRM